MIGARANVCGTNTADIECVQFGASPARDFIQSHDVLGLAGITR
jgi:hypothetical protein